MQKNKIIFLVTSCKKSGPIQQMLNLIIHLDKDVFDPILITIYEENKDGTSVLDEYLPYVNHYYVPTSKLDIMLGRTKKLKNLINYINPRVIHSLGVFPDYAVCRMKMNCQVVTIRNFVFIDYAAKFGRSMGAVLARIHLYALQRTRTTFTCSASLAKQYAEELNLQFPYIRNGVDVSRFSSVIQEEKYQLRGTLGLPADKKILVYAGQFIERKNQRFLLKAFTEDSRFDDVYLVLLGDGNDYAELKDQYGSAKNVSLYGNVNNVQEYLQASDLYVSTSKSEGLPNSVLEAMAVGLPVLLSDIEQHKEIYDANPAIGSLYTQNDQGNFCNTLLGMLNGNLKIAGVQAYKSAHDQFSAEIMSKNYQRAYLEIISQNKAE